MGVWTFVVLFTSLSVVGKAVGILKNRTVLERPDDLS